jgi:hypothetical protein
MRITAKKIGGFYMTQSKKKHHIIIGDNKQNVNSKNIARDLPVNITKQSIMDLLDEGGVKYNKKELKQDLITKLISYVNKSGTPSKVESELIQRIADRKKEFDEPRKEVSGTTLDLNIVKPAEVSKPPPPRPRARVIGSAPPVVRQTIIGAKPKPKPRPAPKPRARKKKSDTMDMIRGFNFDLAKLEKIFAEADS